MKTKRAFLRAFLIMGVVCISHITVYGKIQAFVIPSSSLADSNRIIVVTPPHFDPLKRGGYPFIIMLHGYSGNETQWQRDADLQLLSTKYNILLILPDGGYDGWWIDTDLLSGRNYDTHISVEIKTWLLENFNGSPNPNQQGIMGLSMGGFGAVLQALKYPKSYAAAVSLSGIMDITRHQNNWGLTKSLGDYSDNQDKWEAVNPLHLAQKPPPKSSPAFLLICGRDDFAFEENQTMAVQMKRLGYTSQLREEAGAHTHTFWKTYSGVAVRFIVSKFYK